MVATSTPRRKAEDDYGDLEDFEPDFGEDTDRLVRLLTQQFLDAYKSAAPNVAIDTGMRERAAQFARDRAGELIQDLSDATRDRIKELVADAVGSGASPQELARSIRDDDMFGKARAQTVAVTESAFALGRGQRAAAEDMQQDEQSWIAEADACEECAANADDGWIGLDASYSSGDSIPQHPNCRCDIIYRTSSVSGDDEEKAVKASVRCPDCHRLLGHSVNVGAELWCGRCRESKTVVP